MSRFDDLLPDDNGKSCVHIRFNNPSRSVDKINSLPLLCVGRLINILVLFLLQHLSPIERYSTMKIGRFFFLFEYIYTQHKYRYVKHHPRSLFRLQKVLVSICTFSNHLTITVPISSADRAAEIMDSSLAI